MALTARLPGERGRWPVTVLVALLVLAPALAGCGEAQLIARYDEQTVQAAKALLHKLDTFLIRIHRVLESRGPDAPEARYEAHTEFYDDVYRDISLLRAHAAAIPKNERTEQQIAALEALVKEFEAQHRRGLTASYVETARRLIDTALYSILRAEASKPRR
jgi:hypothetical protein